MKIGKGGPSEWIDRRAHRSITLPIEATTMHLATDPMTQPLGHVTEIDGRAYVTLYRRNHLELWSLGDMGSGGTATMELMSRMPRPSPLNGAEQ